MPECPPDSKECEWKCTVDAAGKQEEKVVATGGDFVAFCVKPALEKRVPAKSKPAGGK